MPFVNIVFIASLLFNILTAMYAIYIYNLARGGALAGIAIVGSLSVFLFGMHHIGEIIFHDSQVGIAVAEAIEVLAGLILILAIREFGKVVKE